MTNVVTILEDHLGLSAGPVVQGHEYRVDATLNITAYTAGGEVITASSLGLNSVTAVVITGLEKGLGTTGYVVAIETDTAGAYASSSSFQVVATDLDGTNVEAGTDDLGMVRVRVWGSV